ncbi:uncharacterized protein C8R40DRAFT_1093647 [Lentinula edodes]|uniref:uncharacterized protein n=1 Tax=Lentinula edodes TaxID=5353 RepID=UPI001E8CC0E2|nr:uncharacterized protein C8R40DRAFT_1093647 [Lentinula edodes]KAH7878074.1 hypothetical protein C8R40DRAFT_1093647 [Lentinula edodes]
MCELLTPSSIIHVMQMTAHKVGPRSITHTRGKIVNFRPPLSIVVASYPYYGCEIAIDTDNHRLSMLERVQLLFLRHMLVALHRDCYHYISPVRQCMTFVLFTKQSTFPLCGLSPLLLTYRNQLFRCGTPLPARFFGQSRAEYQFSESIQISVSSCDAVPAFSILYSTVHILKQNTYLAFSVLPPLIYHTHLAISFPPSLLGFLY